MMALKTVFSTAHFYAQPAWSREKNLAEFGLCHTEHGHGHNYTLWLEFAGDETTLESKKAELQTWMRRLVEPLEHRHLNHDVAEFATKIPTTENIAQWIWDRAQTLSPNHTLTSLRLFEMDDLWVEIHR